MTTPAPESERAQMSAKEFYRQQLAKTHGDEFAKRWSDRGNNMFTWMESYADERVRELDADLARVRGLLQRTLGGLEGNVRRMTRDLAGAGGVLATSALRDAITKDNHLIGEIMGEIRSGAESVEIGKVNSADENGSAETGGEKPSLLRRLAYAYHVEHFHAYTIEPMSACEFPLCKEWLAESSLSSPSPISAREFRQKYYVLPSSLDTYLKAEEFAEAYARHLVSASPELLPTQLGPKEK